MPSHLRSDGHAQAAVLCNELWWRVLANGGLKTPSRRFFHAPGVLSKSFIAGLDLSIGENRPDNRVVAFAVPAPSYILESHTAGAVEQAYAAHHRTQIHEDLQEHGGWPTFLSLQMARNAKCRVPCRLIVARVGDKRFKEHRDGWINLIVHLVGEKRWWVRTDKGVDPVIVTTRPGDFLYMDEGVFHQACITEDSDRSVHLQVAVVTSIPLLVSA